MDAEEASSRLRENAQGGKDKPGIFASLLRYRDPSVEPSKEVKAAKDSGPAETGLLAAKADSEDTRPNLKQEDAQKRSWLNRISGAYSAAERHLAKTLQKLTVPGRVHDFTVARLRLEKAAAEVRGTERVAALRRWLAVLREQEQSSLAQPVIVAQPASPSAASGDSEGDWQQLSSLPVAAGPASNAAERDNGPQRPAAVVFVDSEGQGSCMPMTFRGLFLRSNALEKLLAGYAEEAPGSEEEEELLTELLGACLGGSEHGLHDGLLADLLALSNAQVQCAEAGVPEEQMKAISISCGDALGSLKLQAAVEVLDREMASLRDETAEMAATAALQHKFNSGPSEPSGEITHQRLMLGLTATNEVMALVESLCKLAGERSALLVDAPGGIHRQLLDGLDQRAAALMASISDAEAQVSQTHVQRQEGEAFRARKLEDMGGTLLEVQSEVDTLEAERAALLAQLEQTEIKLTRAQARKADLEEGRNVFEEGNAFTMEALQHRVDELSRLQLQCEAECASVGKCRQLVSRAHYTSRQVQQEAFQQANKAVLDGAREFSHAAARHLYFARAHLQLLLRQLHFCSAELSGNVEKQERMSRMHMDSLLPDVRLQQWHLMQQYLDAEASCHQHLEQVAAVKSRVSAVWDAACNCVTANAAHSELAADQIVADSEPSKELDDLFVSIEALRQELELLQRPEGLPSPGQPLPPQAQQDKEQDAQQPCAAGRTHSDTSSQDVKHQHTASQPEVESSSRASAAPTSAQVAQQTVMDHSDLGLGSLLDSLTEEEQSSSMPRSPPGATSASSGKELTDLTEDSKPDM